MSTNHRKILANSGFCKRLIDHEFEAWSAYRVFMPHLFSTPSPSYNGFPCHWDKLYLKPELRVNG